MGMPCTRRLAIHEAVSGMGGSFPEKKFTLDEIIMP